MVISGQRTDVHEGADIMNSDRKRERLERIRKALRGCLEEVRAPIIEEIRTYPRQIAGCDVQFQDLVEKRDGVSQELNGLEALFRDDIAGTALADAIESFMESSAYIDDQTAGKVRAALKRR
jgi:hypothetical protein